MAQSNMYEADKGWDHLTIKPDQSISFRNSIRVTGTFGIDRFLPDTSTMAQASSIKAKSTIKGCTVDQTALTALAQAQSQIPRFSPLQPERAPDLSVCPKGHECTRK